MLAAGLWVAMPAASAHEPVTETYQERVAPFFETYTEQVFVGYESYEARVAPYTATYTYAVTYEPECAWFCLRTYTYAVYNYETRTRAVYETQTFSRPVYNYETRTRTVHDPHYEPPARTGVTCGPPIQVGSPLWNQLGCDPPPPPRDRSRDDSQDPVIGAVKAIGKAAQAVNDWWVGDPLNGPAEKTFDNLNTVVETAGDVSESMKDIVCSGPGQAIAGEAGPGAGIVIWAGCKATE